MSQSEILDLFGNMSVETSDDTSSDDVVGSSVDVVEMVPAGQHHPILFYEARHPDGTVTYIKPPKNTGAAYPIVEMASRDTLTTEKERIEKRLNELLQTGLLHRGITSTQLRDYLLTLVHTSLDTVHQAGFVSGKTFHEISSERNDA